MNATVKSLRIIAASPGIKPGQFAESYFPRDYSGWDRVCKCGPYGVTRGGGLILWAGGWLGRLKQRGLVDPHHRLTTAGRGYLAEHS